MRISYIKNKHIDKKNISQIDLIHRKNSFIHNRYLIYIFLTELIVAGIMCYISKKSIFDINVYSTYYFNRLTDLTIDKDKYFCFVLLERMKEYVVLALINVTPYKKYGNVIFITYKIAQITCSLCIFVMKFGILGQYIFVITLFPHSIIIGFYIYWVIKRNYYRTVSNKKELIAAIIFNVIIMILFMIVASLLEAYFNVSLVKYFILEK